ncbi:S24 family peptidase [Mesorhizobium sp.]|uniref:S24 family peptidase n=1 Tax=Mesorhizobium sp. TaxID=1871066 RepID=UPI000FE9E8A3|nr:S24 family peptidase [Mesorhizobium sp.]RWO20704.1 MAG: hypothetical protein EOS09_26670 [Mesorhizobium sp.]
MTDEDRKRRAAERVRELRESFGMEQPEFARFIGLPKDGQSSISKWEAGKSAPGAKAAALLALKGGKDALYYQGLEPIASAPSANVRMARIVGEVQAGAWREAIEFPPDEQEPYPVPPSTPNFDMQAFVVRGPSMNQVFPDGTVVLVAGTIANRITPKSGDYVLVQRVNPDGLHEASLKQYVVDVDGSKWLWPRSNDPHYQTPLLVSENDDASITGRVMKAELDFPLARRGR